MFRKIFIVVILLLSWTISDAQSLSKSQIKKEINNLTQEYSLDKQQHKKVAQLIKKREADIQTIEKDKSLSIGEKRRKRDAIQSGSAGSILLLLNDEQRKALFEKKMVKAKEERIEKIKN